MLVSNHTICQSLLWRDTITPYLKKQMLDTSIYLHVSNYYNANIIIKDIDNKLMMIDIKNIVININ